MDCEKYDRIALDLLYEELDELTTAAAERHLSQCTRCRGIESQLRATREVAVVPMVDPPEGLEASILAAERQARRSAPLRQRFGRAVSILAGYSMRPQLAMAALLLIMLGGSLLLLRARPGDADRIRVTERGAPEPEAENAAVIAVEEKREDEPGAAAASKPTAAAAEPEAEERTPVDEARSDDAVAEDGDAATGTDDYGRAMSAYRAGRYAEAVTSFDGVASAGGPKAASAELFAARAARHSKGCRDAIPRFERIASARKGSGVGYEAIWQAADCHRLSGTIDKARAHYRSLLDVTGYGSRARRALAALGSGDSAGAVASRAKRAAPPKAKPKAAPAPASKPAPAASPPPANAYEVDEAL